MFPFVNFWFPLRPPVSLRFTVLFPLGESSPFFPRVLLAWKQEDEERGGGERRGENLEHWNDGIVGLSIPFFAHHSNIPFFHYSFC